MKDLGNKLISNLHVFIILYALYGVYGLYEEHTVQLEALTQQLEPIDTETATLTRKLKEMDEFRKESEASKVRVEQVAKNIETVQRQLPAETNEGQILNFFNGEGKLLNVKDMFIAAGSESPSQLTIAKEFKLKAIGTYLQFAIFFERIGNADRIYNVKELKLISSKTAQKGRFPVITMESTVEAFRFNPSFKVDRGFDKIQAAPTAAPVAAPRGRANRGGGGDE